MPQELKDFIAYCEANPDERFWQALRNWSGAVAIWYQATGEPTDLAAAIPDTISADDTFYWKNFRSKRLRQTK